MIDWEPIRNDYINGDKNAAQLAQEYGVNAGTIRKRASREGWQGAKRGARATVLAMCDAKIAEAAAVGEANRLAAIYEASDKAINLIIAHLTVMEETGKIKIYEVKAVTEALKNLRDLSRSGCDEAEKNKLQRALELLGGVPDALDG